VTSGHEEDGTLIGEVLGGKPISYATIARNLGIAWRTVQRHMSFLAETALLIRRTPDEESGSYSFEVLNCDKWKYLDGKQADGSVKLNGKSFNRRPGVPKP
jgi:DNA-binding transcriptional ArsR family regulator